MNVINYIEKAERQINIKQTTSVAKSVLHIQKPKKQRYMLFYKQHFYKKNQPEFNAK